jgi:predicted SnoaL-like aldol condensation-catalyzing enzyme
VDGLKQYIVQMGLKNLKVRINHVLAEGDLVLIHTEVSVGAVKVASIGFVQMDKGRLVEHWDTAQPVPESSANGNTMFSTKNSYQPRSKAQELANKKLVLGAYQALFGDHDLAALEHWDDAYIQHNPTVADGKAGLLAALESFGVLKSPAHILDVRRVLADGNMVAVQTKQNFGNGDVSVIDLFRVENGKLAEHWDVIQPVPAKAANANTMF